MIEFECIGQSVAVADPESRLCRRRKSAPSRQRVPLEPVGSAVSTGIEYQIADAPCNRFRSSRCRDRLVRWLATAKLRQETGTPMEAPGSAKCASELRYHETRDHRFAHAVRAEHHDKEACRLHEPTCLPHQPHCQRQYVARWVLEPKS